MAEPETTINTHGLAIDYGKHKGELFTRLPVSYLKWMVNNQAPGHNTARAELERRGTVTPDMEISGHAIDRASQQCLSTWKKTRNKDEGLHSWLVRMAGYALESGDRSGNRIFYAGMRFVFLEGELCPTLTTVSLVNRIRK